jgi:hypothetical protein
MAISRAVPPRGNRFFFGVGGAVCQPLCGIFGDSI